MDMELHGHIQLHGGHHNMNIRVKLKKAINVITLIIIGIIFYELIIVFILNFLLQNHLKRGEYSGLFTTFTIKPLFIL